MQKKGGTIVPYLRTGVGVYSMNKTGGRRKMYIAREMRQVGSAAARSFLVPCISMPFFGVKLLYDYGI